MNAITLRDDIYTHYNSKTMECEVAGCCLLVLALKFSFPHFSGYSRKVRTVVGTWFILAICVPVLQHSVRKNAFNNRLVEMNSAPQYIIA